MLGNGDIHCAEDALRMVRETNCDGVMIARSALGDPWLFERVNAALEGLPAPKEPNLQARMNALRRQVEEMVEQKGEFVAMPQARAQTMHYMKGLKGAASLRRYCCELSRFLTSTPSSTRCSSSSAGPRRTPMTPARCRSRKREISDTEKRTDA